MTPQQLVGLAVRLFATWLVLTSLGYLTSIPTAIEASPAAESAPVAYAIVIAYLVGALLLWFFPMVVAHKLLPRTRFENRLSFNAHELARVGSSLMGIWLLAKSLPTLVWFVFRAFLFSAGTDSSFSSLSGETKLDLAVAVFGVAFAAFFVVKARFFATFVVPEVSAPSEAAAAEER